MKKEGISISVVCPFFNEEDMVSLFMAQLFPVLNEIQRTFEIVCVNDGSSDRTLEKLLQEKEQRGHIKIINLSRNFGKESALTAGLDFSSGEAVIPIDSDLQDPPELIKKMIQYWDKGFDVVHAKRSDRISDSFLKRNSALLFYKIHNRLSEIQIPENVGDCRLISRKVVEAIQKMPENQRFMKGIFAWVGFKTVVVEYSRKPRKSGETKFNPWKLFNLGIDGITNFSTVPLRIWLYIGLLISMGAFIYMSFIILRTIILGVDVPGYASLLTVILLLGGIQMVGIGVIGEYIGRMYIETKRRPSYIVEDIY